MRARGAASLEGLDDDHAAAAARTRMRERRRFSAVTGSYIVGLVLRNRRTEQLTRPREFLGARAVGEEAVMADAMEPARQHVGQEAADELVGCECHDLLPLASLGAIVLALEGDAVAVECDQAGVGDGDAMCVAR